MPVYGSWYLTTEAQTQSVTADTPVAVSANTTAGPLGSCTHASPGTLTVNEAGVYEIEAVSTISHDTNNTEIHLEIAIDGVAQTAYEQHRLVSTGGDIGNMSVMGQFTLAEDAVITILVDADKTGDVTWEHLVCTLQRVDD